MSKYSENIPPGIIGAIGWFYDDIPAKATILDVGCSTGYFGAYIKENKNCSVYGVEVSDDKKEAAKVLDGVYSFDLDGEWLKAIYERKYDVIFLGDVIEHLKDPGLALEKLMPLLNKGGRVFISTPNVAHVSVRLELLGGGFEYEKMGILDSTHLKYFTLNSLTNIVQQAGYDIMRIDSSESDYPREVTEEILKKYGLTADEKFWGMMAEPTARAVQYKFVLRPSAKKGKPTLAPSPVKKPEQYKANFIKKYQKEIEKLRAETVELRDLVLAQGKVIEAKTADVEKIAQNLKEATSSMAYRLTKKYRR